MATFSKTRAGKELKWITHIVHNIYCRLVEFCRQNPVILLWICTILSLVWEQNWPKKMLLMFKLLCWPAESCLVWKRPVCELSWTALRFAILCTKAHECSLRDRPCARYEEINIDPAQTIYSILTASQKKSFWNSNNATCPKQIIWHAGAFRITCLQSMLVYQLNQSTASLSGRAVRSPETGFRIGPRGFPSACGSTNITAVFKRSFWRDDLNGPGMHIVSRWFTLAEDENKSTW